MDEKQVSAVIGHLKDVKQLLEGFGSKAEAVAYLTKETKLSTAECANAYDILMKIDAAGK